MISFHVSIKRSRRAKFHDVLVHMKGRTVNFRSENRKEAMQEAFNAVKDISRSLGDESRLGSAALMA